MEKTVGDKPNLLKTLFFEIYIQEKVLTEELAKIVPLIRTKL